MERLSSKEDQVWEILVVYQLPCVRTAPITKANMNALTKRHNKVAFGRIFLDAVIVLYLALKVNLDLVDGHAITLIAPGMLALASNFSRWQQRSGSLFHVILPGISKMLVLEPIECMNNV